LRFKTTGKILLAAIVLLALMLLVARAHDYEQSAKRFKPRIGKALYCVGLPPAPVLCSYHGAPVYHRQTEGEVL
jgi:hypothetical protein